MSNILVIVLTVAKRLHLYFLDIQKAFDSISHPILLYKLSNAGIRGNCLKLLESYLHGRQQILI